MSPQPVHQQISSVSLPLSLSSYPLSPTPRLPPELEREITELVVRDCPTIAVTLTLVARRFQIWIEKIIYKTISLSDQHKCRLFLRTIDARPPQFFASHVKAICLPYFLDTRQASRILSLCSGVENLGCWAQRGWNGPPIYIGAAPSLVGGSNNSTPAVSSPHHITAGYSQLSFASTSKDTIPTDSRLSPASSGHNNKFPSDLHYDAETGTESIFQPRRLSITLRDLFPLVSPLSPPSSSSLPLSLLAVQQQQPASHATPAIPDFTHPLFQNITHLRINDPWTSWTSWCTHLTHIPHLTHLALDFSGLGLGAGSGLGGTSAVLNYGGAGGPGGTRLMLEERVVQACADLQVCILYVGKAEVESVERVFLGDATTTTAVTVLPTTTTTTTTSSPSGVEIDFVPTLEDLRLLFSEENAQLPPPAPRTRTCKDVVAILPYGNPLENWEADARGEMCHWKLAENMLEERRLRELREDVEKMKKLRHLKTVRALRIGGWRNGRAVERRNTV